VINDVLKNGAQLAIITRNPAKNLSDRALYYFNTINPADGKQWSIIHLTKYDEVKNESKALPWRRIRGWSGNDFADFLMFDDEAFNNVTRIELGVTFQLCRNKQGLIWNTYQQGLATWRRAKQLTLLTEPFTQRRRVLIGYSGLPTYWQNLVHNGEGIVETTMPYRNGYALYVADSFPIAKYFSDWNNSFTKQKSKVCEIWVRDYDVWANLNKVWVPENSSNLPQMNSMGWSAEATGMNQENRDQFIQNNAGINTPYVLFSRHFYMAGMPPPSTRWNEMVLYTQVYRALIDAVPMTDDMVKKVTNPKPYPFDKQFKTWKITALKEARAEFLRYREQDLYANSG